MRLVVLLPFVLAAVAVGYWLGVRDRRAALVAAYEATQPLLRATRALLSHDPAQPSYSAVRAVAELELEQFESSARAL